MHGVLGTDSRPPRREGSSGDLVLDQPVCHPARDAMRPSIASRWE